MCQIALSQSTKKTNDSSGSSEKKRATSPHKKSCNPFLKLCQYFWKVQFYTFDNWCDVLRTTFCNSRNVSVERLHDFFVKGLHDFVGGEVAWLLCVERLSDFSHSLRLHDLSLWRLRDYFLWRGCLIFLWRGCLIFVWGEVVWFSHSITHSLTQTAWLIFLEVACFLFVWRGCMIF